MKTSGKLQQNNNHKSCSFFLPQDVMAEALSSRAKRRVKRTMVPSGNDRVGQKWEAPARVGEPNHSCLQNFVNEI